MTNAYLPLTQRYIEYYPEEVALMLEGEPREEVMAFLEQLPLEQYVLIAPHIALQQQSSLSQTLNIKRLEHLFEHYPLTTVLRIFSALTFAKQVELLGQLPRAKSRQLKKMLKHSQMQISSIMTNDYLALSEKTTIEKAILALKASKRKIAIIYSLSEDHKLRGEMSIQSLISQPKTARLHDCHDPAHATLSPTMPIDDAKNHPAWTHHQNLAVVDLEDHLLGSISINTLYEKHLADEHEGNLGLYPIMEQLVDVSYDFIGNVTSSYKHGTKGHE